MPTLTAADLGEIIFAVLTRRNLTDEERCSLVFELAPLRQVRGDMPTAFERKAVAPAPESVAPAGKG